MLGCLKNLCNIRPYYLRLIFRPSSFILSNTSALPRASSTGLRMSGLSQMLEVGNRVLHKTLIKRAEIARTVPKWIPAKEVVEIPIDELPIEPVVVGDEEATSDAVEVDPRAKLIHNRLGIAEFERLLPGESRIRRAPRAATDQR